ncbi:MAG TPA: DUF2189 domain-containing protein [Microvirga sp.]|nr:DUF2189 domain-containing protein [Microvirga sp.]
MAQFHVIAGADEIPAHPVVRKIGPRDLKEALSRGFDDFWAMPSHLLFLALIYPIAGACLAALTFTNNALPLLYPLASGFALLGPLAAIGLYEISRRREMGLEPTWQDAFAVLRSPSIPSIIALGVLLLVIFLAWIGTARMLYEALFGYAAPESYTRFVNEVLTTSQGLQLIVLGNLLGLVFAVVVLSISVISFPLLLDRDVGAAVAVQTSIRAVATNPLTMALWGLIVAGGLVLGSLPVFVGLAIVMPVLGHATWHLYRRVVEPPPPREVLGTERMQAQP